MKLSLARYALLSAGLLASATLARAQTPFLETASVTLLCNFTITGISGTAVGPVPIVPGAPGALDPEDLRPLDRISVDIGTPITYSEGRGDQAFFVKQLIRAVLENRAERSRIIYEQITTASATPLAQIAEAESAIAAIDNALATTTDETARATLVANRAALAAGIVTLQAQVDAIAAPFAGQLARLEADIQYLKREQNGRWELTAVRNAQSTVAGVASTPYAIFLSRVERTRGAVSPTFDTGLRLNPIYSGGTSTETLVGGMVTKATGNYTTHFRLELESFYANDPLSSIEAEDRANKIAGTDYATTGDLWSFGGTGYMTYAIRSTPPPVVAVLPSKIKITGHASWSHEIVDPENPLKFGGVAPLSIKMGEIKYQNRNRFPDFAPNIEL